MVPADSGLAKHADPRVDWRDRLGRRFQTFHESRLSRYVVLSLVLVMYITATALSGSRQLWFDELHTYYIAKAPSLPQLFRELELDLNPPLEYIAVRASLAMFGDNSYTTRLPSIVAFLLGSFCFYRFVSKRLRPVYGLMAVLVFWSTPFFLYATEARPYALIVAWFGMAMLAWDESSKPDRRMAPVLLLALAVTGMMLSHMFSLIYIAPFCLAEAWRLYRTRRFDGAIWAALLLPAVIPLAFVKLMAHFEASLFPPIFEASPRKLAAFYYHTLFPETPALIMAVGAALVAGFRAKRLRTNGTFMAPVDMVFTAGLLALPEILMMALMKTHGAFFPRYAILASFGYALVLVFGVAWFTNRSALAAGVACCVLFVYDAGAIKSAYDRHRIEDEWPAREVAMGRVHPDLPLVVASGLTFLEMGKYALPSTTRRLYYLTGRDLAVKYAHATLFQGFQTLKPYFVIRGTVEPYSQFVAEHPRFLVFGSPEYQEDWLLPCLFDSHAQVKLLGSFGGPYKDYQLFEVTMPAHQSSFNPN